MTDVSKHIPALDYLVKELFVQFENPPHSWSALWDHPSRKVFIEGIFIANYDDCRRILKKLKRQYGELCKECKVAVKDSHHLLTHYELYCDFCIKHKIAREVKYLEKMRSVVTDVNRGRDQFLSYWWLPNYWRESINDYLITGKFSIPAQTAEVTLSITEFEHLLRRDCFGEPQLVGFPDHDEIMRYHVDVWLYRQVYPNMRENKLTPTKIREKVKEIDRQSQFKTGLRQLIEWRFGWSDNDWNSKQVSNLVSDLLYKTFFLRR